MTPKLDWLEAFAEFGEDLNFTWAASRLNVSQPALHAQIKKLGEALEVRLYERRGRTIQLTRAGEDTLQFARQIRDRSRAFARQVKGERPLEPVVLAAGEGAFLYLLGPAVRSFVQSGRSPLRLLTRSAPDAVAALKRGEAHLAVTVVAEPPGGLAGSVLATMRQVVVMRRSHRLARRRKLMTSDLGDEAFVVPSPGSPMRNVLSASVGANGVELRVGVEATGWEPMLHFVNQGLGIAVVNGCCRLPRGLVGIPLADLPRVRYFLLHGPGADEDERVTALRATILRHQDDWRQGSRVADRSDRVLGGL